MGNKRKKSAHNQSRKRKFTGNQHRPDSSVTDAHVDSLVDSDSEVSCSSEAVETVDECSSGPELSGDGETDSDSEGVTWEAYVNRIICLAKLQFLISESCVCSCCKQGSLALSESSRAGLASTLELTCSNCGVSTSGNVAEKTFSFFKSIAKVPLLCV